MQIDLVCLRLVFGLPGDDAPAIGRQELDGIHSMMSMEKPDMAAQNASDELVVTVWEFHVHRFDDRLERELF